MTVTLSICIPTYNRSKYLNNLLNDIPKELSKFPYKYELITSNNASTDETSAVVEAWLERLPITYINQLENIGSSGYLGAAISRASGTFSIYLSDDNFINAFGLKEAVSKLVSQPNLVALYAPWSLINFQEKNNDLLFYNIPEDVLFAKNSHAHLLDFVLKYHIFPEISIFRTEAYKRTPPVTGDIAFWPFTNITHWLAIGDVFFQKQPFYYFSTTYFRGAPRDRT
jgi:glycosyltransferase involved in cell wall biosynthesis